jgi:hypothetical protein
VLFIIGYSAAAKASTVKAVSVVLCIWLGYVVLKVSWLALRF